jgi:ubiquinone/menaquinone biosynthesis C-methylase UbiE
MGAEAAVRRRIQALTQPRALGPELGRFDRAHCVLTLLFEAVRQLVESEHLQKGGTVLDYGCGNMPYRTLFEAKFGTYVGCDVPGNDKADSVLGPHGEIPTDSESVDCVLSTQVLEHVDDPQRYLKEAYRVLNRAGTLILSTHGIWPYHPHPTDYWRWTRTGLSRELEKAGFDVVTLHSVLGPETSALQLWQDATIDRCPRIFRKAYAGWFQAMIRAIERRRKSGPADDAAVYVALARKMSPVRP